MYRGEQRWRHLRELAEIRDRPAPRNRAPSLTTRRLLQQVLAANIEIEDSIIQDCSGGIAGAALNLPTETGHATLRNTVVVRCSGVPAIGVSGGSLTLSEGSLIHDCHASAVLGPG